MTDKHVKIVFNFHSNLFDEETTEKIPAIIVDKEKGLYLIKSVPLFAPMVAFEDLIYAEYNKQNKILTYVNTIDYSGNSVIQIVITKDGVDTKSIEKVFIDLGCRSEGIIEGYFSVGISYDLDYLPVKNKLEELETDEIISYAEPCLSEKHNKDISANT